MDATDAAIVDDILMEEAAYARAALLRLAREDFNVFCEVVLQDEETGRLVKQAPIHERWTELLEETDKVIIMAHVECGKTNQLSIARTVWELGKDPTLRFAIVSNTQRKQADKILRGVGKLISQNSTVREIFPDLVPAQPWTQDMLSVKGALGKDPSVQSFGVHGNVQGSRIDRLILDDVLDYGNTRTQRGRDDLYDWFMSALTGRLTARAKVLFVGTAFHPDDLIHRFQKEGWPVHRFPVLNEFGESNWPERWPLVRIEKRRGEQTPAEFARQMLCLPQADDDQRFKKEWVDLCLDAGEGHVPVRSIYELDLSSLLEDPDPEELTEGSRLSIYEGVRAILSEGMLGLPRSEVLRALEYLGVATFTGVDLAVSKADSADLTAFFDLMVYPDGVKQVLNCEAGRWSGMEIIDRALDHHDRYLSTLIVENNASQDFLVQWLRQRGRDVPLVPFTTGRNKVHPEFGIEGIAAEFSRGEWIIPTVGGAANPQLPTNLNLWLDEIRFFDPKAHTGDRLIASWLAREGARAWIAKRAGRGSIGVRMYG